jgi:hypothetical protein
MLTTIASAQQQLSVQLLPNFLPVMQAHQQAGQQQDNLCGPYWTSVLLQSRGLDITPEAIAQLAGSVLPICDPQDSVPPGAQPRLDYRLPLPTTERVSESGTSAQGLIDAVKQLTPSYGFVPLQANWTAERVQAVLQLCQNPDWQAVPLCNIRTVHLWGTGLMVSDAVAYLSGQPMTPPASDWDVGHFVLLAGTVTGADTGGTEPANSLVVVCDTYFNFGWQSYHLQSAEAVAQALNRDDGKGGGILLFVSSQDQPEVRQQAEALGFEISVWDNGSPIP